MANNVQSCKQINERAQTDNFYDLSYPSKTLFWCSFFFGENQPCVDTFQPNEDPPLIYIVGKDVSISEIILFLSDPGIPDVRTMGDLTDMEPAVSVPNSIL